MRFALATLVAGLGYLTIRRSLVVAREVLVAAGREDLAQWSQVALRGQEHVIQIGLD